LSATRGTWREWLRFAQTCYAQHGLALGQIATSAHDEALYLILHTLGLPMDSDEGVLAQPLSAEERAALTEVFRRRVFEHTPAAYLTREAWLGDQRFYVDERVLIPRSYFLELIGPPLDELMGRPREAVRRVVDVCTGSGCLAILLAQHFPNARVDGIDLSTDALDVARINVCEHGLVGRVALHQSDVFDALPRPTSAAEKYDLILSNPPYEPRARTAMRCQSSLRASRASRLMAAATGSTSSASSLPKRGSDSPPMASC